VVHRKAYEVRTHKRSEKSQIWIKRVVVLVIISRIDVGQRATLLSYSTVVSSSTKVNWMDPCVLVHALHRDLCL